MNKRLLLALYDRSGFGAYMPVDYKGHELAVEEHIEKFAELIVAECANVCVSMQLIGPYKEVQDATLKDAAVQIKQHFGVE